MAKVPRNSVCISSVSEAELRYGLAKVPAATKLKTLVGRFLLAVEILAWDSDAAKHYGILRAQLERDGMTMGNLDMMIAAHALAEGCTLVSNDGAFARVKNLKLADWTKG
jgi:tRNA(fMet)-specific endonuclease VapC